MSTSKWRAALVAAGTACVALAAVSCGGGRSPFSREKVVVDEQHSLPDGESLLLHLEPGKYRAEVTVAGDGVSVEWRGAACPGSSDTHTFTTSCEFAAEGQILVRNPPETGAGEPAAVHVKVLKLPL